MTNTTEILLHSPLSPDQGSEPWERILLSNVQAVLEAPVGAQVRRYGYPALTVAQRVWRPSEASPLLPYRVNLTSDGIGIEEGWCTCSDLSEDDWLRYDIWTIAGRVSDGYACPDCRGITQIGGSVLLQWID